METVNGQRWISDCMWWSSRPSDQLKRRHDGHTWTCCSMERLLIWRLADRSGLRVATLATSLQKSDRYQRTEWCRQRNVLVLILNLTRWGMLSHWSLLRKISVSPLLHGHVYMFRWLHGTVSVACVVFITSCFSISLWLFNFHKEDLILLHERNINQIPLVN